MSKLFKTKALVTEPYFRFLKVDSIPFIAVTFLFVFPRKIFGNYISIRKYDDMQLSLTEMCTCVFLIICRLLRGT